MFKLPYVRQNKGYFEDALSLDLKAYHLQLVEGKVNNIRDLLINKDAGIAK